jgi:hypothetical protein
LLLEAGQPAGLIGVLAYGLTGPMSHAEVPTRTLQVSRESFVAALEESFSLLRSVFRVVASTILDIRGNLPPVVDAPLQQSSRDTRPRTLVERAIEISMRGMFSQANIDAVFDLARILREVHVPATHVFWRRNDPAVMAVRVFSGVIRCTNEHGESALVSDDHTLGTMATFALRPHAYTAVAETDVSAYQMTSEEFLVILEAQPKLAMRLLASLAELLARAI